LNETNHFEQNSDRARVSHSHAAVVAIGTSLLFLVVYGCSTLLLYQHHVIDVVSGFAFAALVMYAIDGLPWRLPKIGGTMFAALYAAMAVMFVVPLEFWCIVRRATHEAPPSSPLGC
jgi:hypothetical protein